MNQDGDDTSNSVSMEVDDEAQLNVYQPASSSILLEQDLPLDTARLLLSFLTLADFQRLSVCSHRLYRMVSHSTCITMEDACEQLPRSGGSMNTSATTRAVADLAERFRAQHQQQTTQPVHCRRLVDASFVDRPERLDKSGLNLLLHRYTRLRELHLAGLAPVGDALLRLLNQAPAARALHALTLRGATLTYWCPDTLQLPNLKRLRITAGSIRASLALLFGQTVGLEYLALEQCSTLRDDQLRALLAPQASTLTELHVHQCMRIRRPCIHLNRLERLSLMGCFALTELPRLHTPLLRDLNLSFCFRLDSAEIQNALEQLPSLETLKLVKCPLLESLEIEDSPHFRSLNVNYCGALAQLRVWQCPAFDSLETTGCQALHTLVLQDVVAMEYLNLSTLPIRRLQVTAPQLRHLELQNCKHLDDCWIRSPNLYRVNVHGSRTVALRFCKAVRSALIEHYWMPRTPMEL